jgi:DNA-directed RNA polymerase subunit beta'
MTPTQDITLGCYYLTAEPRQQRKEGDRHRLFATKDEVIFAHVEGDLRTHDRVQIANPDFGRKTIYGDANKKLIDTTVGRVIFSEIWPAELGFPNRPIKKSEIGDLIWSCYKVCGHERTVVVLDKLKELGFREATRSGCSIGIDDMIIPKEKTHEIELAQKQITDVEKQYRKGVITPGERYNKIVDIWTHCTDQIASVMLKTSGSTTPCSSWLIPAPAVTRRRSASWPASAASWPSPPATSSRNRFSRTSAKASRCSSTSSRPTAPARVSPTPPSRPPTPGT